MNLQKLFFLWVSYLFLSPFLCFGNNEFSLSLSIEKNSYYEEEEVILSFTIENLSGEDKQIEIEYLQPVENRFLFAGEVFHLIVNFNDRLIENFTNHMPPEPKPGIFPVSIKPREKVMWKIPFPYYYYPLPLPGQFRVKLQYQDCISNEIVFNVQKSPGKKTDGSIIKNPTFSQGLNYPYGWKIKNKTILWDKENHMLVFNLNKKTAEGEGLWIYSLFYEIHAPAEFSLSVRLKSSAPDVIIFVEGWGLVGGRRRRIERNECFGETGSEWRENTFNLVFTKQEVKWVRIKLYSYLRAGTVYFDSIYLNKK
jgi:hypothetical protein